MQDTKVILQKTGLSDSEIDQLIAKLDSEFFLSFAPKRTDWRNNLDLKIEFLFEHLGIEPDVLIKQPNTLFFNYDRDTFIQDAKTDCDNLQKHFNLNKHTIQKAPYLLCYDCSPGATSQYSINQKYKKYNQLLGFGEKEFNRAPSLLSFNVSDSSSLLYEKIAYLKNVLGFDKSTFKRMPDILLLSFSKEAEHSVPNKVQYLEKLGFTKKHLKSTPGLLRLDCDPNSTNPTSVKQKLNHLAQMGITRKSVNSLPRLLLKDCDPDSTNPSSIAQKIKFYQDYLGFDIKILNSATRLLALNTDTQTDNPCAVINKYSILTQDIGIAPSELKKFPNLLYCDCDPNSNNPNSIHNKARIIQNCLEKPLYKTAPILLNMPVGAIKVRCMLSKLTGVKSSNMSIFIQNEQKTYARWRLIEDLDFYVKPSTITYHESAFQSLLGVPSNDVMEDYPLTKEALLYIQNSYNALPDINPVFLSEKEIEYCAVKIN